MSMCNLIVSTTHNNEGMNRAVGWVADNVISGHEDVTEGMLNQGGGRHSCLRPCLSCATHALGHMPLMLQIEDAHGARGPSCARAMTLADVSGRPLLIYGIGESGRQDDGLGPAVVEQLAAAGVPDGITLESGYQLVPEDALFCPSRLRDLRRCD